jgi:hypothetical protein
LLIKGNSKKNVSRWFKNVEQKYQLFQLRLYSFQAEWLLAEPQNLQDLHPAICSGSSDVHFVGFRCVQLTLHASRYFRSC